MQSGPIGEKVQQAREVYERLLESGLATPIVGVAHLVAHVPRTRNKTPDALLNKVLDENLGQILQWNTAALTLLSEWLPFLAAARMSPGNFEIRGEIVQLSPDLAERWPRLVMRSDGGFRKSTGRSAFGVVGDIALPMAGQTERWRRERFVSFAQEISATDSFQAEAAGILAAMVTLQQLFQEFTAATFQRACGVQARDM